METIELTNIFDSLVNISNYNDKKKVKDIYKEFVLSEKFNVDYLKKNKDNEVDGTGVPIRKLFWSDLMGFCSIGQGGGSLNNNYVKFVNEIKFENETECYESFFEGADFDNDKCTKAGTAKIVENRNFNGSEKKYCLTNVCRRFVIILCPDKFLDLVDESQLKTINNWLRDNFEGYKQPENQNWYNLNRTIFDFLFKKIKEQKGEQDKDLALKVSSFGWVLRDYINLNICGLLLKNYNLVLTGAPGTGKSYMAKQIAKQITGDYDTQEHWEMVQFHASYDYTDFVEGMRPKKEAGKDITFGYHEGHFRKFCSKAAKAAKEEDKEQKYVFIIDEINRGEVNKIFGELFYSIDPDKRGEDGKITTQYSTINDLDKDPFKDGFYVPENVYIIGTMNDIDRSVESLDFAFRRRFLWKEVKWSDTFDGILGSSQKIENASDSKLFDKIGNAFKSLNEKIERDLGSQYCIGGSYAQKIDKLDCKDNDILEELWKYFIENIISEYLRGEESLKIADFKNAFTKKPTTKQPEE